MLRCNPCRKYALALPTQLCVFRCETCRGCQPDIAPEVGDTWTVRAPAVCTIATTPHTLLGSALSLLLVFRTNASYARLVEGRRVCVSCGSQKYERAAISQGDAESQALAETCVVLRPHEGLLCGQGSDFWRAADVGPAGTECTGVDPPDSSLLPQGAAP